MPAASRVMRTTISMPLGLESTAKCCECDLNFPRAGSLKRIANIL